jgi:hypothetical protein
MKLKIFLVGILILLMISIPTQAGVTVDKTVIDIVAGDSFTMSYQLTYSGKGTMCYVTTTITPDSEGINLTYNSSFVLTSTPMVFNILVNTSMRLVPQPYIITTTFEIESQPASAVRRHNHRVSSPVVVIPSVDDTTPPVDDTNTTIPPVIVIPLHIDEPSGEWNPLYSVAIAIVAIAILTLLFLLAKKKRNKK